MIVQTKAIPSRAHPMTLTSAVNMVFILFVTSEHALSAIASKHPITSVRAVRWCATGPVSVIELAAMKVADSYLI